MAMQSRDGAVRYGGDATTAGITAVTIRGDRATNVA
jgi:hypothetical protein